MLKWTIGLVLVVVFLSLAVVGLLSLRQGEPVEVAQAERTVVRQFIDERASTRLPQVHRITMPFGGRIEEITLDVNDQVAKNEVVARLVPADLQFEVDEAQAVVAGLQASIEENNDKQTETLTYEQTLKMVEAMVATVTAAENRMRSSAKRATFAEDFLARMRRLEEQGARTEEAVDRAEVEKVDADVSVEEDRLTVQIIKSYLAATQIMPKLVLQYMADQNLQQAVLRSQKAEAEARLRQVQQKQARGEMKSPVDGVILKRSVENERFLPAGEVLLEIGDLSQLQVEADVLSEHVVQVKVGQEVEVYGAAIGGGLGHGVPATVAKIYPAGFTKTSSLGVEEQRVKVIIQFEPEVLTQLRNQFALGVDFRVRVRVFTAESSNAIAIPRSALFRSASGQWQVFVVRGPTAEQVNVSVGLMNDAQVEILDGIRPDDLVVLAPQSHLNSGSRVRPILSPLEVQKMR